MSLFRQQVVERQHRFYGDILLILPTSLRALTWGFALAGVLLMAFAAYGEFTKKEKVSGVLLPADGIVDLYAGRRGTIIQSLVKEGDLVDAGETLYVISSDTSSPGERKLLAQMNALLQERIQSMTSKREVTAALYQERQQRIRQEIEALKTDLESSQQLLTIRSREVQLAKATFTAFQRSHKKQLTSDVDLYQQESTYLNHQISAHTLKDKINSIQTAISRQQNALNELGLEAQLEQTRINDDIRELEQRQIANEAQREYSIQAPVKGIVSSINQQTGEVSAGDEHPVLSLLPVDQPLHAYLYVPSRAIGFLKEGMSVALRYQAFPYQKFGQYGGTILQISRTPVALDTLPYQPQKQDSKEAFVYRVKVALERDTVEVYGQARPLRPGMQLEASIAVETRRIYEWLIEPLNSLSDHLNPKETDL